VSDLRREGLLFRDGRGDIYLLPCEVLEKHRVRRERRADLEQSIAEPDVVGFGYPTSPVPPRTPSSEPFRGLRLLGQWSVPAAYFVADQSRSDA
jgi:hypothetical protein